MLSTATTSTSNTTLTNLPTAIGPKVDLVEDAIKRRQREAEERKKRILAAYDVAAKSAPAGALKEVDLDVTKKIDSKLSVLFRQLRMLIAHSDLQSSNTK